MKKLSLFIIIGLLFAACDKDDNNTIESGNTVEISLGADYTNDIYYSLKNGVVKTISRTDWDIAFYTDPRASTIIINDGNNAKLYVADAIANWDKVTSVPNTPALYNTYNDTTWENGAFDKGKTTDVFDYGWGSYDMATHNVIGDSVHVIELANGIVKKLIIEKRDATNNTYNIKYANLDGTDEYSDVITMSDHSDKNFVHYSLVNKTTVNHEPASESWDLMFTTYYDQDIPYIVTGVLANEGITIAELAQTATTNNNYQNASYLSVINTIGSDWKEFNHSTLSYEVVSDLVYFIKDKDGNYHKLFFTSFGGTSNGNIEFNLTNY